jgi:hypothetical protein
MKTSESDQAGKKGSVPRTLCCETQAGRAHDGTQIVQRLLQLVINNNIVEFPDMAHLGLGCGKAAGNYLVAISAATGQATGQFFH